jgi:uncharacterized protein (DUF2336 family)
MAFRRLAGFVSGALLDLLQSRSDTDPETAAAVAETVQRRLAESEGAGRADAESDDDDPIDDKVRLPVSEAEICRVAEAGNAALVAAALARDSGLERRVVRRILASASPKAIVALVWKAGHTMKMAMVLQATLGRIPPNQRLAARTGDGGFPLSESDLAWQLEIFQAPERVG